MKDLYEIAIKENSGYFMNGNEKVFVPIEGELLKCFLRRILSQLENEVFSGNEKRIITKAVSNPFRGYELLEFTVDSKDSLAVAIEKYKDAYNKLNMRLIGDN